MEKFSDKLKRISNEGIFIRDRITKKTFLKFKEKVSHYKFNKDLDSTDTFVKDMMFLLGKSIADKEYDYSNGFDKFIKVIKEML